MPENNNILSVKQLNEMIKLMLESSDMLNNITVRGEISNFTNHASGHLYFSLKDNDSVIKAIMFRSSASKLKFMPQDGMRVIVTAKVSAYVKSGDYQLYISSMEPDGVGALYIAYEQLKNRLAAEGMFDADKKKALPKIPTRIGVITSPTGAAVRDIINITGRRFPYAEVILYPALVQGEDAAPSLCNGICYFNAAKSVDVIIIGRGGGSMEDLWAFNDERLARLVAASEIPVISAVGHETDFTICDFAADRRAPTPSAAAELAVPDMLELKRKINNVTAFMEKIVRGNLTLCRQRLNQSASRRVLQSPAAVIDDKRMQLVNLENRLYSSEEINITHTRAEFSALTAKLEALNPMSVITRGYGAVFSRDNEVIKSVDQVCRGEHFKVQLSDGTINATADEIKRG